MKSVGRARCHVERHLSVITDLRILCSFSAPNSILCQACVERQRRSAECTTIQWPLKARARAPQTAKLPEKPSTHICIQRVDRYVFIQESFLSLISAFVIRCLQLYEQTFPLFHILPKYVVRFFTRIAYRYAVLSAISFGPKFCYEFSTSSRTPLHCCALLVCVLHIRLAIYFIPQKQHQLQITCCA